MSENHERLNEEIENNESILNLGELTQKIVDDQLQKLENAQEEEQQIEYLNEKEQFDYLSEKFAITSINSKFKVTMSQLRSLFSPIDFKKQVKIIQYFLGKYGYYNGPSNGIFDTITAQAFVNYFDEKLISNLEIYDNKEKKIDNICKPVFDQIENNNGMISINQALELIDGKNNRFNIGLIQYNLRKKGYYPYNIDYDFGRVTLIALKKFYLDLHDISYREKYEADKAKFEILMEDFGQIIEKNRKKTSPRLFRNYFQEKNLDYSYHLGLIQYFLRQYGYYDYNIDNDFGLETTDGIYLYYLNNILAENIKLTTRPFSFEKYKKSPLASMIIDTPKLIPFNLKKSYGTFLGFRQYHLILTKYNGKSDKEASLMRDQTIDQDIRFPLIFDGLSKLVPHNLENVKSYYPKIGNMINIDNYKNKDLLIITKDSNGFTICLFYEKGRLTVATYTSLGIDGYRTPGGVFNLKKLAGRKYKTSNMRFNYPMPYSMQVHNDSFIHHGETDGESKSHGCIRIPGYYMEYIYEKCKSGTTIVVNN